MKTFLSVCAGIEAASVAWNPLGWRAVALSEIDPFARSVLRHRYPTVPNWGDMTKYEDWPHAAIDVLSGGTPCQSYSLAGLRGGMDDPRGNLMLTFGAIAARYRPEWVVWENVPGVLSSNGGRDFGAFLGLLGQCGYGFAYRVFDAQYFGVPQRRRRVFVVGRLGNWRSAAAVLFERHGLQGHIAPGERAPDGTPRSPDDGIGGRGGVICAATGQAGAELGYDLAPTLTCAHEVPYMVEPIRQARQNCIAFDARQDPVNSQTAFGALGSSSPQAQAIAYTTKLHNTTSNNAGKIFRERSTCLDASSPPPALLTAAQLRRLTPRECERLQGFPDDWTLVPHRGRPAADHPRYKAIGNSWAVPVVRWIGRRIEMVDAIAAEQVAA